MFENWFVRHQDRGSMILHAIGIPLTIVAVPAVILAVVSGRVWLYGLAGAFVVAGYAMQFVGHWIEGNDAGEVILIKKLLGRPYKAIADRSKKQAVDKRETGI